MAISTVSVRNVSDDASVMWKVTEFTINWIGFRILWIISVETSKINWQWDYETYKKVQTHLIGNTKVKQQP